MGLIDKIKNIDYSGLAKKAGKKMIVPAAVLTASAVAVVTYSYYSANQDAKKKASQAKQAKKSAVKKSTHTTTPQPASSTKQAGQPTYSTQPVPGGYVNKTFRLGNGETTFRLEKGAEKLFHNYLHLRRLNGEKALNANDVAKIIYMMDSSGNPDLTLSVGEVKPYEAYERRRLATYWKKEHPTDQGMPIPHTPDMRKKIRKMQKQYRKR